MPRFKIKFNDDAIFFSPFTKKRQSVKISKKVDLTPLSALLFNADYKGIEYKSKQIGNKSKNSLNEEIVLNGNSGKTS